MSCARCRGSVGVVRYPLGKSKSSSSQSSSQSTTTHDEDIVTGDDSVVYRSEGDLTVTDHGTVELAGDAVQGVLEGFERFATETQQVNKGVLTTVSQFLSKDRSEGAQTFETMIKWGAAATAVVFVSRAVWGSK